jgi:hypothetical protein
VPSEAKVRIQFGDPAVKADFLVLQKKGELYKIAMQWLELARQGAARMEPCADRPNQPLDGCVKLRFGAEDRPLAGVVGPTADWRLVLEYLPSQDRPEKLFIWSVGLGHPERNRRASSAYELAAQRRGRRLAEDNRYRKEVMGW